MKVALVHEWLIDPGGSEAVLEQLLLLYPQADLFALADFFPESARPLLHGRQPRCTFLQNLPGVRRHYRHTLPLMPLAIEQLDLSAYDLVISSSHAVAKGVLTGPDQLHLCYCHSPMRYAWDLQHQYLRESRLTGLRGAAARLVLHYLRLWDTRTANGVDHFAANSEFIARRIRKTYGRAATVIPPPVDTAYYTPALGARSELYFSAGRFVPYKRMDLLLEAFALSPRRRLVLAGGGPDWERCRRLAPPNVEFAGYLPREALRAHLRSARAFLFAAEEDFGIAPVEAMACGTPVVAYGRGGVLDSVLPGTTGLFFAEQTAASLVAALDRFETLRFDPAAVRARALSFSAEQFRARFSSFAQRAMSVAAPAAFAVSGGP